MAAEHPMITREMPDPTKAMQSRGDANHSRGPDEDVNAWNSPSKGKPWNHKSSSKKKLTTEKRSLSKRD